MDIKQYAESIGIRLFAAFIGRSSSGKSAAAASMPKPFHEIDTDIRANGIVNAVQQGWLSPDGIDIEQFDNFKGYLPLQTHLNSLYTLACARQMNYKSIDVGSGDSVCRLLDLTTLNPQMNTQNHLNIAGMAMTGPADYKFESQAFHKIIDFLRMLPCNVTISFKVVNQYGKKPGAKEGDPAVIIGERFTLTANLAENVLGQFNDVYKFSKVMVNGVDKYFVEFVSEIARNSFQIPPGLFDITRKPFYPFFTQLVTEIREGKFKKENYFSNQNSIGGLGL